MRKAVAPAAGAALGFVAFACGLGLDVANLRNTAWVLVESDHRIHFLGWHMFRHASWEWPPGAVSTYGHPIGTSIAYTDSIPVLAYLFKAIGPAIAGDVQYLGLWLMLCYMLQGLFAALLLRRVTDQPWLQVVGAALFVLSPPLVFRHGHPALSAHWLLLAALLLYFSTERWRRRTFAGWAAIAVVAAATHPYLTLMVLALAAAHHGRLALAGPVQTIAIPIGSMLAVAALVGAVFWLNGYFIIQDGSQMQATGLGEFSMNALALIMPREGSVLFDQGWIPYATGGQYEGYAYFGAGGLLLLVLVIGAGIATRRIPVTFGPRLQHAPLWAACTALLLMALSPRVTAGGVLLFAYDERWWGPLTLFRASGRMFWPVFYLLLLGVVTAITRWFRLSIALALLSTAVVVQAVDLSGTFAQLRQVRLRAWHDTLRSPLWSIVPHYRHIVLVPTNICASRETAIDFVPFVLRAGRAGATINAGFAARYDAGTIANYCDEASRRFRTGDVRDDELYVVRPELARSLQAAARTPLVCAPADSLQVCSTGERYAYWQDLYDVTRQQLPPADEMQRFHATLELIYRERLQRPLVPSAWAAAEAIEWVTRYLAYRTTGCGHDEAASLIQDQIGGGRRTRLCQSPDRAGAGLPPSGEVLGFRHQLDALAPARSAAAVQSTSIDLEGQAIWTHEYVRVRSGGQSESEAAASVLAQIRQITGT